MRGALLILAVTVAVGVLLWLSDRLRLRRRAAAADEPEAGEPVHDSAESRAGAVNSASADSDAADGECCGLHLMCEKMGDAAFTDKIVYYDDEELDRFAGRLPGDYTPQEAEEFRDVLMTMLPADVPGWAHSLDLRGIRPPQEIRDEVLMIVREL